MTAAGPAGRVIPGQCAICGNDRDLVKHCPKSPGCRWVRCLACNWVTGIVAGQARAIPPATGR